MRSARRDARQRTASSALPDALPALPHEGLPNLLLTLPLGRKDLVFGALYQGSGALRLQGLHIALLQRGGRA